jgi:hypothetical protein
MANMMDMHTVSVCRMNLVGAGVVFLHGELIKMIGEVVGGARVHVPPMINIVGCSLASTTAMCGSSCNLTVHVSPIIVAA